MADEVSLALRWQESGADIPQRTATDLRNLEHAAAGARGELGDRLATAFARLEAREPTMALRRTALAIESLAGSALGATGPLARLGEVGLLLGAGTGTGLAIETGIAAIGGLYKMLTAEAEKAAAATKHLHEEVSALAKAGPEAKELHLGRERGQAGTDLAAATSKLAELHVAFDKVASPHMRLLAEGAGQLDAWKERVDAARKAWQDQLTVVRELKGALADLTRPGELGPIDVVPDFALMRKRHEDELPTRPQDRVGADLYLRAALGQAGNIPSAGLTSAGTTPLANTVASVMNAGKFYETPEPGPLGKDKQIDAVHLAGHAAAFLGAVGRGGNVFSSLGGVMSAIPGLGVAGAIVGGLGGIFGGIFGHKKMVVTIGEYEHQALDQMKELRGDPLTTSWIFVGGGDIRQTQYQLGRLARRDAVTRLP